MKCPDCKGGGEYIGAGTIEPEKCHRCKGVGELNDDGTVIDPKAKALDSVFNSNLPDWMEDYKDEIGDLKLGEVKTYEYTAKVPKLKIGDTVHVFDADWYEAEVVHFGTYQGMNIVRADYVCGRFFINVDDVCWNDTQKRWEHIRSGTPLWP